MYEFDSGDAKAKLQFKGARVTVATQVAQAGQVKVETPLQNIGAWRFPGRRKEAKADSRSPQGAEGVQLSQKVVSLSAISWMHSCRSVPSIQPWPTSRLPSRTGMHDLRKALNPRPAGASRVSRALWALRHDTTRHRELHSPIPHL